MTPVQQNKLRRAGVGLRAWDRDKACTGLTLVYNGRIDGPDHTFLSSTP